MSELKCPHCGKTFQVDESDYAAILNQVKNAEFEKEIHARLQTLDAQHKAEQETAVLKSKEGYELQLAEKDRKIAELNEQVNNNATLVANARLEEQSKNKDALQEKEREIYDLKSQLGTAQADAARKEDEMKKTFELQLQLKEDEINLYKDLKAKMSTKMIGESLEVHCSNEFNRVRSMAFPNAYFEKDNDASGGSKGDFIFRDYEDGVEYISIMFEMKNEADETATKHKNEGFFQKLDKDRNEKKCEYAVLVSLLEKDNDLYNQGIVDVSYRYPKMFVIRPQFFLSIISLLSNASKNSVQYKKELAILHQQNIDVTKFEEKVMTFRKKFEGHYQDASDKFNNAIGEIDKAIKELEKTKQYLLGSEKCLRLANEDTSALSIRSLTYQNPTMKKMFDDARNKANQEEKENGSTEEAAEETGQ